MDFDCCGLRGPNTGRVGSYSRKEWHVNLEDGENSRGWIPLLKLEAQLGDAPTNFLWNLASVADTGVVEEDVICKFNESARKKA